MNKNILEIKKIKKFFKHKNGIIKIFNEINLNIKKGDLVAVVGPSGSGKSTLLNIISLLDLPNSGQIFFKGKNLKNLNEREKNNIRKNQISIIFQNNNLLNDFTAIENVVMPLILMNFLVVSSKELQLHVH